MQRIGLDGWRRLTGTSESESLGIKVLIGLNAALLWGDATTPTS